MSVVLSFAVSAALVCYALSMALAAFRLLRGPSALDRVLALDFISLNGILVVLALAIRYSSRMYFEAALLMALFGFVASAALAKFLLRGEVVE